MELKLKLATIFTFLLFTINAFAYWPAGIHDPSTIIKCKDTYWIYGTGPGVKAMYSQDLVNWETGPSPFTGGSYPDWIKNHAPKFDGFFWAPDCVFMNGKYYLYYSASEWGTKNSCIGVTVNETLDPNDPKYKWTDLGRVVSSGYSSNFNAIDAALTRDPVTKKVWFVYGSFNSAGIQVFELDTISGKAKNISTQKSIANNWVGGNNYMGEGATIFYKEGYFYLMMNFGGCCDGIKSS